MKSIFKRQKLFFISLIGIILTSSFLLFSYAYQKVKVDYADTSKTGMSLNVGKLDVSFTTTNRINLSNMSLIEDYKSASYTEFTVDNAKSTKEIYYGIKLIDLEYSENLKSEDFKYTLTEIDGTEEKIIGSDDFKILNGTSYDICFNINGSYYIKQGNNRKLRLYLWLKETEENQNNLENSSFKGKIQINSYLSNEVNTLPMCNLKIYGNSTQEENPTPESPKEVLSLGENGRNLFDINNILNISDYFTSVVTDNEIAITRISNVADTNVPFYIINKSFASGTKLTFSAQNIYSTSANSTAVLKNTIRLKVHYTDNTVGWFFIGNSISPFGNVITLPKDVTSIEVVLTNISNCQWQQNETIVFDGIQVEVGTKKTEYRPYKYIDVVSSSENIFDISKITDTTGLINNGNGTLTVSEYAVWTERLYNLCPDLKVGDNVTFFMNTTSSKKFIYLSIPQTYLRVGMNITITPDILNSYVVWYCELKDGVYSSATISDIMFVRGKIVETPIFEPYQIPITKTIDLMGHEPLRKVGNVADYIDYKNKKIIRNIGVANINDLLKKTGSQYSNGLCRMQWSSTTLFNPNYNIAPLSTNFIGNADPIVISANNITLSSTYSQTYLYLNSSDVGLEPVTSTTNSVEIGTAIKNYLAPLNAKLYYVLATPIEEPIDLPAINLLNSLEKITATDELLKSSKIE